ncbi:unnamed protein product [Clonostachys rosea]|uniref:Glyoxalase-like domain-containing protein n=1 Tax=Bionectria ochroleuca TaxID=29856 RepID=A0ABY6TW56_BIOOC|nr:unnamed protein product [Clonostachys rosea]
MEGSTRTNMDTVPQATADCKTSPGPADSIDMSGSVQSTDKGGFLDHVVVFLPDVNRFINTYQAGSMRIRHLKQVTFVGEENDGPYCDPFAPTDDLEDKVDPKVLAPEHQERIFSALCSVWNHISTWDLEEPITLAIHGRFFRSNEQRLADLAQQKNIMRLVCKGAAFADPLDQLKIAKCIPKLEKLWIQVRHMRKELRTALAHDIRTWNTTLPKLNALALFGEEEDDLSRGDDRTLEDMRVDGVDLLCRELRLLTQKRGFLALQLVFVPISTELWEDTQNRKAKMKWPTLKQMDICVHEMTSTGKWLFSKPPKSSGTWIMNPDSNDPNAEVAVGLFKRSVPIKKEAIRTYLGEDA